MCKNNTYNLVDSNTDICDPFSQTVGRNVRISSDIVGKKHIYY